MKFRKIQRPKLQRQKAKIIRRYADVCPWCGAVESLRAYATKRIDGHIMRYSRCVKCGGPVTRMLLIDRK